jgi:uncharacterized protein (TIGR03792 family)
LRVWWNGVFVKSSDERAIISPGAAGKEYDLFVAGPGAIPRSDSDRSGHRAGFSAQGCQCCDPAETCFFHDIRHLGFPLRCLLVVSFFRHVCDLNLTCCPTVAGRWRDCVRIPVISRSYLDNLGLYVLRDVLSKWIGQPIRKRRSQNWIRGNSDGNSRCCPFHNDAGFAGLLPNTQMTHGAHALVTFLQKVHPMVIEWLRISVPNDAQSLFLAQDEAIWTQALAAQPGFLGKECWRDETDPDSLHLVIRWRSREHWKAIPRQFLDAVQTEFELALGTTYAVDACLCYDILTQLPPKTA